jgi:hypothetical protein
MGPPRNRYAIHMSNKKKKAINALQIESANPHQLTNGQQSTKEVVLGPDDHRMNFSIIIANRNPETNADEEGHMTTSKKTRKSKRNKKNKKARKQAEDAKMDDEDKDDGSVDQQDVNNNVIV